MPIDLYPIGKSQNCALSQDATLTLHAAGFDRGPGFVKRSGYGRRLVTGGCAGQPLRKTCPMSASDHADDVVAALWDQLEPELQARIIERLADLAVAAVLHKPNEEHYGSPRRSEPDVPPSEDQASTSGPHHH